MPPKEKERLDARTVAALAEWVKQGAVWPAERVASDRETSKRHWAFQRLLDRRSGSRETTGKHGIPSMRSFSTNSMGRVVPLPRGGSPHADSSRHVRSDRAATDAGRSRGVRDRPQARRLRTDRRAAPRSPAYGERWGRHWLDIARYADTKGYVFQEERRYHIPTPTATTSSAHS